MSGERVHAGGCLCGAIRYGISTPLKCITHCYCGMCRKQHGAAFATYAMVGRKHVSIEDPAGLLAHYVSSPGITRSFCSRCGSSLFWQTERAPKLIDIAVATLDTDPEQPVRAHIFVASKPAWVKISDDLPQYPESFPDDGPGQAIGRP